MKNVEHGSFTPLVYSLTSGKGPETSIFHKNIAQKIVNKTEEKYGKSSNIDQMQIIFLILRSVLLCITGSSSTSKDSLALDDVSDVFCNRFVLIWT